MDATALRAMQAPIKERYKGDPGAAMITLKAKGTLDDQNIACKVETGRALSIAGLHPATARARPVSTLQAMCWSSSVPLALSVILAAPGSPL